MATINVNTGYGYVIDPDGNKVSYLVLPKGEHPITDGYQYVEVDSEDALYAVTLDKKEIFSWDEQKVKRELLAAFETKLDEIAGVFPFISEMLKFGNDSAFQTLKSFIAKLETDGKISSANVATFKAVLNNNGVDLDAL